MKIFQSKSKKLFFIISSLDLNQAKTVNEIKDKHQELMIYKTKFFKFIKKEWNKETVNLSIKLAKFKEYDCQVNIYTFQSEFEKIDL